MDPQKIQIITDWSGGKLICGDPSGMVSGISTDSRSIRPGELFLALSGERFDGYEFLRAALESGASGVVVSSPIDNFKERWPDRSLIVVEDTLVALTGIARKYRDHFEIEAIAVTGSNGKTTTKDLIGQLLSAEMETLVAPASYNNLIGVSLTILLLEKRYRAVVFELGMNHQGEILELAGLCHPRAAVITNIGPAHIGYLGSIEAISAAKSEILRRLEGEKITFFNADDEMVREIVKLPPGPVVGFGFSDAAEIRASNPRYHSEGVSFDLRIAGRELRIRSPLPGRHNVYNLLAALAVGEYLGISPDLLAESVRLCVLPSRRMEMEMVGGVELVDDAYNANPVSMRAALSAWQRMECRGRRIMVSGDMNELGEFSTREHQEWGKVLGKSALDYLIFVGPRSNESSRAASGEGFLKGKIFSVEDSPAAAELLSGLIEPGDSVLIKGSNNMKMGRIVRDLKERDKK
jgi:UDP-N-acetylmuramoyl-tripeptide--D-alanyl-D-alanine ligase